MQYCTRWPVLKSEQIVSFQSSIYSTVVELFTADTVRLRIDMAGGSAMEIRKAHIHLRET